MDVEIEPTDSATAAFDAVRDKLAGLTRAVDNMAGEWRALDVPDYSQTLEKIAKELRANAIHIERLSAAPSLQLTPHSLSDAIIKAGTASRAEDHAALSEATARLQRAEQAITKSLVTARTAQEQDNRLKRVGINSLIAGMVIWSVVPGPVIRALPEKWHLPERVAARILGTDACDGGNCLILFAQPGSKPVNCSPSTNSSQSKTARPR